MGEGHQETGIHYAAGSGLCVSVGPFGYLDEKAFRFNEREGEDVDRFFKTLGGAQRDAG